MVQKNKLILGRTLIICQYKNDKKVYKLLHNYANTPILTKPVIIYPNAVQIFIGDRISYSDKDIKKYMKLATIEKITKLGLKIIIHSNYLARISRNVKTNQRPLNSIVNELISAKYLKAYGVVVHLGTMKIPNKKELMDKKDGIKNIIGSVIYIISRFHSNFKKNANNFPKLMLETSAGQGSEIELNPHELSRVISKINKKLEISKSMLGICIDTCHIFAAGYDIRKKEGMKKYLDDFAKTPILSIHLNDCKFPLKSHRDVHANIGCGYITSKNLGGSLSGMKYLLNFAHHNNIPIVLETPSHACSDLGSIQTDINSSEMQLVYKLSKGEKNIKIEHC